MEQRNRYSDELGQLRNLVGPGSTGASARTNDTGSRTTETEVRQMDTGTRPRQPHVNFNWVQEEERRDLNFEVMANQNVQRAGRLNAEIRNLESAIRRNVTLQGDNLPVITPGRLIQTPYPDLITEDLVAELNRLVTDCSLECSMRLIRAQREALERLRNDRQQLGREFHPNAAELEEMARIQEARTYQQRPYNHRPRTEGPMQFWTMPNFERGQRYIGVNHRVTSYLSTGNRYPRNDRDNDHDRARDQDHRLGPRQRNSSGVRHDGRQHPPRPRSRPRSHDQYRQDDRQDRQRRRNSNGYDTDRQSDYNSGYESDWRSPRPKNY